jgi:hypothetical protein
MMKKFENIVPAVQTKNPQGINPGGPGTCPLGDTRLV